MINHLFKLLCWKEFIKLYSFCCLLSLKKKKKIAKAKYINKTLKLKKLLDFDVCFHHGLVSITLYTTS